MPFSFEDLLKRSLQSSYHTYFSNPIYTAVVIVLMLMFIIFFYLGGEDITNLWGTVLRIGFYSLIMVGGILSIHYYGMRQEYEEQQRSREAEKLIKASGYGEVFPHYELQPQKVGEVYGYASAPMPAPAPPQKTNGASEGVPLIPSAAYRPVNTAGVASASST